jgi:hypothetical protein
VIAKAEGPGVEERTFDRDRPAFEDVHPAALTAHADLDPDALAMIVPTTSVFDSSNSSLWNGSRSPVESSLVA